MTSGESRPGWFGRNWKWAVPLFAIAFPLLACIGTSVVVGLVVQPQLDAFAEVVQKRVEADPTIAANLGGAPHLTQKVAVGMKSSFISFEDAVISFSVPVVGPNGRGVVAGNGRKGDNGVEISQISLHLPDRGRPIELPSRPR